MNDRIKQLREALGLSQEAFGEKIGITRSGVSNIESGLRGVSDRHIMLLRAAFNANEEWLRTGEGEMLEKSDASIVEAAAKQYGLDSGEQAILEAYLNFPPDFREAIKKAIIDMADAIRQRESEEFCDNITDDELDRMAAEYRAQLPDLSDKIG